MTEHEQDLAWLVNLLANLGEECERVSNNNPDVRRNALGFAFKLTGHAASALTLLRDKSALVAEGPRFLDPPSLLLLARAGWEAFILLHWIFVAPADDEDERRLRYQRWSLESPRRRQHFDVILDGQEEQKEKERRSIEAVELAIKGNPAFTRRSRSDQHNLLREGGRWRPGYPAMARAAGIAKQFADDHYAVLCDHAHSGWLSINSLKGSLTEEKANQIGEAVTLSLGIATANVIASLRYLFPDLRPMTAEAARRVAAWTAAGRGEMS